MKIKKITSKDKLEGSSLKIAYNFSCHINCETCEYAGISLDNQKCLSCGNGFCYMKHEKNCFSLNSLIYKYYNEVVMKRRNKLKLFLHHLMEKKKYLKNTIIQCHGFLFLLKIRIRKNVRK